MSSQAPVSASGRPALEVARFCAHEGAKIALRRLHRPQKVDVKGRGNFVTQADLDIEARIHEIISREFPEHTILSEETAATTDTDGWVWIVDPLDGTGNYTWGIPFFGVNIALCLDGQPTVAFTFDPSRDESFWAEAGRGAWVNGEPARASDKPDVQNSVLAVGLAYNDERGKNMLHIAHDLFPGVQAIRIPGSAALSFAYAACGRFDLFLHNQLFPWDLAAGILLAKEAGAVITDGRGGNISVHSESAIVGGPHVHADFLCMQSERGWQLTPA